MTRSQLFAAARMDLEFPMSLGVDERYVSVEQAVDYPADEGFPVQNLEIVGTDLRSVERVTGRLTRGNIAAAGALPGLWIGLFVGIAFSLFSDRNQLGFLISTPRPERCSGGCGARSATAPQPAAATATSPRSTELWPPNANGWRPTSTLRGHELLATMPREATTCHITLPSCTPTDGPGSNLAPTHL
jgi:hypothetical protein